MPVVQNKKLNTKTMVKKIPNFEYGTIWEDSISGHRVGCLNASKKEDVKKMMQNEKAILAIQDPPYNVDIMMNSENCLLTNILDGVKTGLIIQ